jgi:hypothetical protein
MNIARSLARTLARTHLAGHSPLYAEQQLVRPGQHHGRSLFAGRPQWADVTSSQASAEAESTTSTPKLAEEAQGIVAVHGDAAPTPRRTRRGRGGRPADETTDATPRIADLAPGDVIPAAALSKEKLREFKQQDRGSRSGQTRWESPPSRVERPRSDVAPPAQGAWGRDRSDNESREYASPPKRWTPRQGGDEESVPFKPARYRQEQDGQSQQYSRPDRTSRPPWKQDTFSGRDQAPSATPFRRNEQPEPSADRPPRRFPWERDVPPPRHNTYNQDRPFSRDQSFERPRSPRPRDDSPPSFRFPRNDRPDANSAPNTWTSRPRFEDRRSAPRGDGAPERRDDRPWRQEGRPEQRTPSSGYRFNRFSDSAPSDRPDHDSARPYAKKPTQDTNQWRGESRGDGAGYGRNGSGWRNNDRGDVKQGARPSGFRPDSKEGSTKAPSSRKNSAAPTAGIAEDEAL